MTLGRKYYVISLHADGSHEVEICSDLKEIIFRCSSVLCDDANSLLFIDAGFLWPQTEDFLDILKKSYGEVLISQHASSFLPEIATLHKVDSYHEASTGENVMVHLVDHECSNKFWDPTLLLSFCPEWVLEERISNLAKLPAATRKKCIYYEIDIVRDLLDFPSGHALLCLPSFEKKDLAELCKSIIKSIKRGKPHLEETIIDEPQVDLTSSIDDSSSIPFEKWIINADVYDPIAILQRSPEWLLELDISSLIGIPIRLVHRCGSHGATKVSDLLQHTSSSILKWDGVGETSLRDFSESIITTLASHGDEESDKFIEAIFDVPVSSALSFEEWVETADHVDPIAILNKSPEWLLGLDASTLVQLPVRLKNRLDRHGIEKVEDLLNYSSQSILTWPEVGRKSLVQLSRSIIATVAAGQAKDLNNEESESKFFDTTFRKQFENALNSLTDREEKILRMRLSYRRNKPMTLEEVGFEFSVTRERIRQIEAKAYKKLKTLPLWRDGIFEKKVTDLMSSRSEPCYLDLIAIEDDWFEGFSSDTKCLGMLIEDACSGKLKPISIGGRDVITRISGEDWVHAKQDVISILETYLPSQLTKDDVLLLIESHLGKYGSQELTSTLFDKIAPQLHFVPSDDGGNEELASIGKSANSIVLAALKASPVPLHYSEVHSLCLSMGYEVDVRRVHNALSDVARLFSLGTYGLKKHFPLSQSEEAELLSQLEDIILTGDPERQWNSAALLEQLLIMHPETPEAVDKYIINIVLSGSKILSFLGRFVWIRSEHAKQQNISRIDIQEASTALIKKSGRPMSASELKQRIKKQRGMSEFFCLKVTNLISRVSLGIWGMVDRDFHLNRHQINQLLGFLYGKLLSENNGLYIDEARESLENNGQYIPEQLTDYMIFSLALTDSRFAVRRGQILALAEWPDARRLTIREASCKAASELKELICSSDLRPRVEALVGRKVSESNQFNEGIRDAGFVYSEQKHAWVPKASDSDS